MPEPLEFILFSASHVTFEWSKLAMLLVVILFFAGIIVLLVAGKSTRKIAAGLLAAMFALFVLAMFITVPVSQSSRPMPSASQVQRPKATTQSYQQIDGLKWPADNKMPSEELYFASPYKYRGSAVRGLARQCGNYLLEKDLKNITTLRIGSFKTPTDQIDETEYNQLFSDRLEFISELTKQLPPSVTISDEIKDELGDNEIAILLNFSTPNKSRNYTSFPSEKPLYRDGEYSADVVADSTSPRKFQTQYEQIEWVTNFSNYNQNCQNAFMHVSAEWKPNERDAKSDAIQEAARALTPMLKERIDQSLGSRRWNGDSISRSEVESRLAEHLRRCATTAQINPIVDRFSQVLTLENGMGSYREELLLYPQGFEPVVAMFVAQNQQQRQTVRIRLFSMVGLLAVVLVTYFSANAATRGYATVSIGLICFLAFVAGIFWIRLAFS